MQLVPTSPVLAQRRPDETAADYDRRTQAEAREAARREDAARGQAAQPNQTGGSYADQLGRQYANQWARQAAEEKRLEEARRQAQQQFEHEQARQREEAAKAAKLQAKLKELAAQRQLAWLNLRVSMGFSAQLSRFREGKGDNDDLLKMLLFASWFPRHAELSGAAAFLQTAGGEKPRESTLIVLERILEEGNILPLWHCALLEADPAGNYGVGELFGRWVHATLPPSVEPEYWLLREQIDAGLTSGWDAQLWRLGDPDSLQRTVLQWNDLPGATLKIGFVYGGPATQPVIVNAGRLDPARREAVPALDVLASAVCSGAFGESFRSALWKPNVERVRRWNPAYADVFEVYARWWEDQERTPAELEVLLRRAKAAGGRPALFAETYLKGMRKNGWLLSQRLLAAKSDPVAQQLLEAEKKLYPETLWVEWEQLMMKPGSEPLSEGFLEQWERFMERPVSLQNMGGLVKAGNQEALVLMRTQVFKQASSCLYPVGQITPGSAVEARARAVLEALAFLVEQDSDTLDYRRSQLELGVAAGQKEAVLAAAGYFVARSDAELGEESSDLLLALALATVPPYSLPVDKTRQTAWVKRVLEQEGVVPPVLLPCLPAAEALVPGSEPWMARVRTLRNNLWPERARPYALEEAWRLCQTGFGLDGTHTVDARVLGYALLGSLESMGYVPAKEKVASIRTAGSVEEQALALCGDLYVADVFVVADGLLERALANDAVALRALELWILLDKLPLDAVQDPYLKALPALKTPAVEAWIRQCLQTAPAPGAP